VLNKESVVGSVSSEATPSSAVHSLIGGRLSASHGAALAKMVHHHMRKLAGGSMAGFSSSGSRVSGGREALSGLY
jgi:hypothetical protein